MAQTLSERYKSLQSELETTSKRLENEQERSEYFKESYNEAVRSMLAMDNIGWNQLTGYNTNDEGLALDQIQEVRRLLHEWTDTNPLLWNGWDARCAYLFGNGYEVTREEEGQTIAKRVQDLIDKPVNQEIIFGDEALKTNERERYTGGIVLVKYSKSKQEFSRLNLDEIEQVIIDPDNPERVWYYYRHYTRDTINFATGMVEPKEVKVWYRTDRADVYNAPKIAAINGVKVDPDIVVVDDIVNRKAGQTFGMPDAFPAAPWALAYSAYLRDGTKVMAALAEWAWKFTPKNKAVGSNAGAAIKANGDGAGQVAITDGDLTPIPRAGAVNLGEGRAIAAQVASALGLSVMVILMDVGEGGSFGAAETLSDPGLRIILQRQNLNGRFLERCIRLFGVKDPKVIWEKIMPDADYREQQTLVGSLGTGLFWPDEIRQPLAKVAKIELKHSKAPDGFLLPNNKKSWERTDIDPAETITAQAAGQQAPAAAAPGAGPVKPDGTTGLTNGQGKAVNTAKPSYGVNDLRGTGGRAK